MQFERRQESHLSASSVSKDVVDAHTWKRRKLDGEGQTHCSGINALFREEAYLGKSRELERDWAQQALTSSLDQARSVTRETWAGMDI
jgi:hypothetical protein